MGRLHQGAFVSKEHAFQRLATKIVPQSKFIRSWSLEGGVSAQITAFEIEHADGQRQKLIVRQHGIIDRQENPHIAADEYRLLQGLKAAGLPTPEPYLYDQTGEFFETPAIVIAYIEGETHFHPHDLNSYLYQLASQLARIHRVNYEHLGLTFLPSQQHITDRKLRNQPTRFDTSINEERIREVLRENWPFPQMHNVTLLHGDYWPGNILWRHGELVAVIDWEDARIGDPLADLANARLELLWHLDEFAMQEFTRIYFSLNPLDECALPYWDLWAALRVAFQLPNWAANATIEAKMRNSHHDFVNQAFRKLKYKLDAGS
jgi:aminoglycoside phosphotransferase (APT) family kinase protein